MILNLILITVVAGATGVYPLLISRVYDAFAARDERALLLAPVLVARELRNRQKV